MPLTLRTLFEDKSRSVGFFLQRSGGGVEKGGDVPREDTLGEA